ncbi:hypothetical protein [Lachnoclostridium phytofermentans]|uniref:Uncharacterized protein n=1 Tax=Lachnoclostridium phytofermentans (strain ATCC 700394 / DSM 18823 / ISDg) TaxID=357809 RepID=A9KN49_LACP7|nr:hypothetical protein [Lachnoclostridium phytofermentans]ABX41548.1 hypothetical protein Cphy_1170 [Lachnoclostridium phytofermentans ISDg]
MEKRLDLILDERKQRKRFLFRTIITWTLLLCLLLFLILKGNTLIAGGDLNKIHPLVEGEYSFEKCLYMHPLSSYCPSETTGQLYVIGEDYFQILEEKTHKEEKLFSGITWQVKEVDEEEWNKLFKFKDIYNGDIYNINHFSIRLQYDIEEGLSIYQMDDEIWLARISDKMLWSLYKLKLDNPSAFLNPVQKPLINV